MPCSEEPLYRLHSKISRCFSKNGRTPILKKKPLRLIKWPKAGLENLLGRSCIKRRIGRIAIRDYQMGGYQKPSRSFNDATYKCWARGSFGN